MRILAATDFSTRSNRAVRQAGLIAQGVGADLHIAHVIDDDRPSQLKDMEKREARRILEEQIQVMPELGGVRCFPEVVEGDPFDGILRSAGSIRPDLIVMGQYRRQMLRDILVGTTIERVVRAGSFPVLMVNNEALRRYERVVAAVDMSDTSARALLVALKTGLLEVAPTLVHAFEAPAKGNMKLGDAQTTAIDEYVAAERSQARRHLTEFLTAHDLQHRDWPMLMEEGRPSEVLSRAVREKRPDLLVMGTRGRSKVITALIGSVTEECLRSFDVDVLAVPLSR